MISAMTRNLGYRKTADRWLRELLETADAPDVLLVQEILPGLVQSTLDGYTVVEGQTAPSGVSGRTSALLIADRLGAAKPILVEAPFVRLGTYASAATLDRADGPLCLVSVHTSPSPVSAEWMKSDYATRSCEAGPWWSDAFLAELAVFASTGPQRVIIAGDLNQALDYDAANGHRCGAEFFETVQRLGFVDVTARDWNGVERPTRKDPDYQLDRVFVSADFADRVSVQGDELVHDSASDHAAIRFSIDA